MNTSFDASAVIRACLLLLGLLVAVFFGILIGEANWTILAAIVAFVAIASVAQFTVKHLVGISLFLAAIDLWMAPTGFKIGPMEQVGIIAVCSWLLVCWRRNFNPTAPKAFTELRSWSVFQSIVMVAAAYAAAHFIYNMVDPYEDAAFGWKGASKAYAQTYGAFLMIILLTRTHLLPAFDSKGSTKLLWLFLCALIVSVGIGIARAIVVGPEQDTGLSVEQKSEMSKLFTIPLLNAHDNLYTLRQLGPASVLIGSTFFFSRPRNLRPSLPLAIVFLGIVGSVFSGGRAALVFSLMFAILAMVRARRATLAFGVVGLSVIAMSIIFVLPSSILKESPWHVQRSVGWFRPDVRTQATEGIEASSRWRKDYFDYAWDHYRNGDARMILFGRSVGQMESADFLSFALFNELGQMEFAVRRLGTHNGLTDFLLGWGLLGYLLIIAMCLSCVVALFSYLSRFDTNSHGSSWLFSAAMFMTFWLVYTHVGGGFVWPIAIVLVLVALSQTDGLAESNSAANRNKGRGS